jgi:hypothetical protein
LVYFPTPNNGPLHFERIYLAHFKINFNDFCGFVCARCIIRKYFWGSKILKQWPKILNSKLQIVFISLNQIVTPSISKGISWSFQNQFEQFLWLWMHLVKDYIISLNLIDNALIFKDLKLFICLSTFVAS